MPRISTFILEVSSNYDSGANLDQGDDFRVSETVAAKAKKYGVQRLPAIVINGKLAECCANRGIDAKVLRSAGVGLQLT